VRWLATKRRKGHVVITDAVAEEKPRYFSEGEARGGLDQPPFSTLGKCAIAMRPDRVIDPRAETALGDEGGYKSTGEPPYMRSCGRPATGRRPRV
jgi:hypothetical protein